MPSPPDRLERMLATQRDLQKRVMRYPLDTLTTEQRVAYVKDMVLALSNELQAEVLGEVSWKPWTTGPAYVNASAYKGELVDCWHFFMNLMLAVDMTADELYEGYLAKRSRNEQRQREGYDGVSGKCPGCRRSYDDGGLCRPSSVSTGGAPAWCGEAVNFVGPGSQIG